MKQLDPQLQEVLVNIILFISGWLTRLIQKTKFKNSGNTN